MKIPLALFAFTRSAVVKDKTTSTTTSAPFLSSLPTKIKMNEAAELYNEYFSFSGEPTAISVAPGRVNLIGEHTDYTGGFVLPFAIDYSTIVVGSGSLSVDGSDDLKTSASLQFVSSQNPKDKVTIDLTSESTPPAKDDISWTTYVAGTVYQYLADLPKGTHMNLQFAITGDVPLGSGLSSSASLEVAVARFVETVLGKMAFSSEEQKEDSNFSAAKVRALRCQKAENTWCQSPCGIMDQYVSSAAESGAFLLIDCTSLEYQETKMAETENSPVIVVANSNVQHDIAGGEYPVRVAQCKTATKALSGLNPEISTLRHASLEDVEDAKWLMDDISYKRAKHVVTENARTLEAKEALEAGDWTKVGTLMNDSHASMRDDYEVSCEEVDILVEIAQNYPGVYGSRLTGGGFGGCTVTLVDKEQAEGLIEHIQTEYKAKTDKECPCFQTKPSKGAHVLDVSCLTQN